MMIDGLKRWGCVAIAAVLSCSCGNALEIPKSKCGARLWAKAEERDAEELLGNLRKAGLV